ncbi:MAG: MBL fold metallo-hydrolase RNA specificity domain-containing protein [Candidatus Micrarchaeia archaeon]
MNIGFLGAAGEVGRSCILVENGRKKTLLDAGVKFKEGEAFPLLENRLIPKLNNVVLTHAHMDHSGYLPALYAHGYKGKVMLTKPTRDLTQVLLADYLRISHDVPYDQAHVTKYLQHCQILDYEREQAGVLLRTAGHILGSATVTLNEGGHRILYTGDINLRDSRLLEGAKTDYRADTLIIESTYGADADRHLPTNEATRYLAESIKKTFKKGGKVIVPTFAIGRGQEVLFTIESQMRAKAIPNSPIYIDGMINKILKIYRNNSIHLNKEIQRRILTSDQDPFKSEHYHVPVRKDRGDVFQHHKVIVLTTSGMLNGGPVLTYIKKLAPFPQNKIILVGYQAEGTRGRELLAGADELTIDDRKVPINCEIDEAKFSAHSDQHELLELVKRVKGLKRVYIVHGEKEKSEELARAIQRRHSSVRVELPKLGEEFKFN